MDSIGVRNNTLQPSFASKLVAALNTKAPIYDSKVRAFLSIPDPDRSEIEERKKYVLGIYEKINDFYQSDNYSELRDVMIQEFEDRVEMGSLISDTKKVDYVLWSLGIQNVKLNKIKNLLY